MADLNITFIGAGNMAASLINGLLRETNESEAPQPVIRVADPFEAQLKSFADRGIETFTDNNAAISQANLVVLAVKPQVAAQVVSDLTLQSSQLLVSIAAGISLDSLDSWTPEGQPIVRCMPNTPALFGAGITALFGNPACSDADRQNAQQVLDAAGTTLWVETEEALDAVTAVSGSGPAYFFLLMEAMIDAGVALGLKPEIAQQLTLQTAYGAAVMATQGTHPPATLRENVTSPGGTTAAALSVMTEQGLPDTVQAALRAAAIRSAELAVEFGTAPSENPKA